MAMSGKKSPNLGAIHVGATRWEVEVQLGSSQKTTSNPDGTRTDIYEYQVGNDPNTGRALVHGVLDILTLGIWEVVGTPIEAMQGDTFNLLIKYDIEDKAESINSVAVPPSKNDEDQQNAYLDEEQGTVAISAAASKPKIFGGSSGVSTGIPMAKLAEQLLTNVEEHGISRIAVLPLHDAFHQENKPLGNYLTEKLTIALYQIGSVRVIERSQLNQVIEEAHLSLSGRFDDDSVQRIGKLLGADAVVVGSYMHLGNGLVEVNSRIVNVETGEILGVGTVNISSAVLTPFLKPARLK
jgi:TolB-like protein